MNSHNRIYAWVLITLAFLFSTLACSFSGIQLNGKNAQVNVTLKEDSINDLLRHSKDDVESTLLHNISKIDLQDGQMRVFGSYTQPDGSEIEGSYDVTMSAKDHELQVQIVAVNIDGVDMTDPRIEKTNQTLSEDLSQTYENSNGEVSIESAEITEDALHLVINAQLDQK